MPPDEPPLTSAPSPEEERRRKLMLRLSIGGGCLALLLIAAAAISAATYIFYQKQQHSLVVAKPLEPIPEEPALPSTPIEPAPTPAAPRATPAPLVPAEVFPPLPVRPQVFVNLNDKSLPPAMAQHYVEFLFAYPQEWLLDPGERPNGRSFVKVGGVVPDGSTTESLSVINWTPEPKVADQVFLPKLLGQYSEIFTKTVADYHTVSIGPGPAGFYSGLELRFTGRNQAGRQMWGKVVALPRQNLNQKDGPLLFLIATDASPYVKGLAEVGVKGQLPLALNTFRWGEQLVRQAPVMQAVKAPAEMLFVLLDANLDGSLTGQELLNGQYLRYDANGDGSVSKEEFIAGVGAAGGIIQAPGTAVPAAEPSATGVYVGTAFNNGETGSVRLEILNVNAKTGKVSARLSTADGLYGKGDLTGTLRNGALELSGPYSFTNIFWQMKARGQFVTKTRLNGSFTLTPQTRNSGPPQAGTFVADRVAQ